MKLECSQTQIQARERKTKKKKIGHKNCRGCGSSNLLVVGPDQFCCDCDWNTCLEYVGKGLMNNLHYAYSEHFPSQSSARNKIVELPKGNAPINPDAPAVTTESTRKKSA